MRIKLKEKTYGGLVLLIYIRSSIFCVVSFEGPEINGGFLRLVFRFIFINRTTFIFCAVSFEGPEINVFFCVSFSDSFSQIRRNPDN